MTRASGGNVNLAGADAMDSAIMHTVHSSDDSMVLAVPEPAAAAMGNLKVLYQLGAALGSVLLAQWGWLSVTALASSTAAGALIVRLWPATRT